MNEWVRLFLPIVVIVPLMIAVLARAGRRQARQFAAEASTALLEESSPLIKQPTRPLEEWLDPSTRTLKAPFWKTAGAITGYVLLGIVLLFALVGGGRSVLFVLVLLAAFVAVSLVSLLGRLAAGFLVGWNRAVVSVGPCVWSLGPSSIGMICRTLAWNPFPNVICCPVNFKQARVRGAIFALGGTVMLMTLLLAEAIVWVSLGQFDPVPMTLADSIFYMGTLTVVGIVFTLVSATFWLFVKKERIACMILTGESIAGDRPRDWNAELVALAQCPSNSMIHQWTGILYAYYKAIDTVDVGRAEELLMKLAIFPKGLPRLARSQAAMEVAYFLAHAKMDVESARAWYDEGSPMTFDIPSRLRAETAILVALGYREEALARAKMAIEELSESPRTGTTIAEKEWTLGVLQSVT